MEPVALLQSLQCPLPERDQKELKQRLEDYINYLIQNDFGRLVQLLYTIDIDEQKLKHILLQQPEHDAAQIITDLIFSRQQEKRNSRQEFTQASAIDEDERW